ncbi:tripartite tricarboxylate transporter substrate binding protein [Limnohabitans sp.]|uniref:Bug family tripartite tricarboxylate transporter substrate binding protein n=1 Tax=Limnohabitans sp. TaxID=1907725 RepID=UPI00286EF2F0|nr:tripartite tricarboxylate transporter substrate binding protein [Limnohabitans sp.]
MERRQFMYSLVAATSAVTTSVWAQAEAWPDKPIKFVLSQPPGSGPDNVARLLGDRLGKSLGQPIVIDNKPGGQNVIGAQAAARSTPDGYTFYFATTAALITNTLLFKQLAYDAQKDFVPVAFVARSPFAILVDANSPIQNLDDLIAKSKASNGQFSIGNEGPRTFSGMIARLFNARSKSAANLVPYANVGVGSQNLMGGHVDAMVADLASTAQLAKQGKLRVIATTAAKRVPGWENVPALSEKLGNFDMVGWFAIVAPKGTPPQAIAKMNREVNLLLADKDLSSRIANIGPLADATMTEADVAKFLSAELARWTDVTKEIGILPE